MDVFNLRRNLVDDYRAYVESFIQIADQRVGDRVRDDLNGGALWPEPLIQLNPAFEAGGTIAALVDEGVLHDECRRVFRIKPKPEDQGKELQLHLHQTQAIRAARAGRNYVLTTGTGSGKSLAYVIPIVDHVLRQGRGRGIQAIVVYPMNALANSQHGELTKFLCHGYPDGQGPVRFARYTGQESEQEKQAIVTNPPDILLTNYVMLELILTRPTERQLVAAAKGLRFLVLDELHTYRGRQGADVALLLRRTRDALDASSLQCVGTSATLAGPGSWDAQRGEVAQVASLLFGATVAPSDVIGETLRRATPLRDVGDTAVRDALTRRVRDARCPSSDDNVAFVNDPLSSWIETTFGLTTEPSSGRLIRTKPRSIGGLGGAAHELTTLTGLDEASCGRSIQEALLAGYQCRKPEGGFPVFAFRLHQFISRGDTVYASPEPEGDRYVTLQGQRFVPGADRKRALLPLVFCRECGQEYFCVRQLTDEATNCRVFEPRELSDRQSDAATEAGFLHFSSTHAWPSNAEDVLLRVPEEWIEDSRNGPHIKRDRREDLPRAVRVGPDAHEADEGIDAHFLPSPFRFCLRCGVAYGARQSSDFGKLTSLGSEGRSTATTILSLSAIRRLRADPLLPAKAKKLLSFTDNRQDAALQAGHFNDFVEVGLLRAGLFKACNDAGADGLRHDELTQRVFAALALPLGAYATDPDVRFEAKTQTERALRDVIGYRIYRDLKRGWRITAPNLEQCGLLEIRYLSLDDVCRAEDVWTTLHPVLRSAAPETRIAVAKTLLDYMRRELAIKVDYLAEGPQERIQLQSNQRLIQPWALDDPEVFERASVLYPRGSRGHDDYGGNVYLSPRGGFGQYLRRTATFPEHDHKVNVKETEQIAADLLKALKVAGLVEVVQEPQSKDDVPGYQLPASAMAWVSGDGFRAFHDPIRIPRAPEEGLRSNRFFVSFYREAALQAGGIEAREHTAQVTYKDREDREERFRDARLPILYCSPTMELGVDISELNAVNLRNIPPTPANYAQRSGRAGRSGQPALVFSYCSTGSPHDQYFFKRPDRMVAGAVSPPRLDLANEDLVRAHVQATWLAEAGLSLGKSLKEVLDLSGDEPTLDLNESVRHDVEDAAPRARAKRRIGRILTDGLMSAELQRADWFAAGWVDEVLSHVPLEFERACSRWRELYRSALKQREIQNRIIGDASRPPDDKKQAKRLRGEAEAQLDLLTDAENVVQSDFYSYRYFASEGFLPGYNFPRLPLSAFIPGRRKSKGRDEFLSRPRFLAISEFGPRAIVYHEGARYLINRVILPVRDDQNAPVTTSAKQCDGCGYLHPTIGAAAPDLCERCHRALPASLTDLFRLQNIATKRRDRISSDEEERLRLGYELRSGVRFVEHGGRPAVRIADIVLGERMLARLSYGHAATITRINLGWARRKDKHIHGFTLDTERGYWARSEDIPDDDADTDDLSPNRKRVIPFVEDRRNCLLIEPAATLSPSQMASLQSALKSAIQVTNQLEDNELAAEPLPTRADRKLLLFFEASEGGAGVLRRLVEDPRAVGEVCREALRVCHFDPENGTDLRRAHGSNEDCEAACYDCLMSYGNQIDHGLLDRKSIVEVLTELASGAVRAAPAAAARVEHLAELMRLAGSRLERRWLEFIETRRLRLPTRAQVLIESCGTRPDFSYDDCHATIYVDGPVHDFPDRHRRDVEKQQALEDQGYSVIRFRHDDEWPDVVARYPNVFGRST